MSLIYITGPSGAGKSSVKNELIARDYEAHDADEGISAWFSRETNKPVEYPKDAAIRGDDWQERHIVKMSEQAVAQLARRASEKPIFLCGIAPNDLELVKYFSSVICLMIDEAKMKERVTTRDNNQYGKAPDQLAAILKWYEPTVEKYRNYGAVIIDASMPINTVVDEILEKAELS